MRKNLHIFPSRLFDDDREAAFGDEPQSVRLVVADDLDDDGVNAAMDQADVAAADAAADLADMFEEDLFPDADAAGPLSPESSRA